MRGPFEVIKRSNKYFIVKVGTKEDSTSVDRLKAAYADNSIPVTVAQPPRRGRPTSHPITQPQARTSSLDLKLGPQAWTSSLYLKLKPQAQTSSSDLKSGPQAWTSIGTPSASPDQSVPVPPTTSTTEISTPQPTYPEMTTRHGRTTRILQCFMD